MKIIPTLGTLPLLLTLLASASESLPLPKAGEVYCYKREYTAEQLNRHPGQVPAVLWLKFGSEKPEYYDPSHLAVGVKIQRRQDPSHRHFANGGACRPDGNGSYRCGFECDAGQFRIRAGAEAGTLVIDNQFMALTGCGDEDGEQVEVRGADNQTFELSSAAVAECDKFFEH